MSRSRIRCWLRIMERSFPQSRAVEDFLRQLEFNLERLGQHARGENVIYERCPLDFLAYINALDPKCAEALRNESQKRCNNSI